ncbi:MAG: hypothetical protein KGL90_01860 [Burkholderiales bacterium]|nr:hypothetical protein [Burkholderiales bacterium]
MPPFITPESTLDGPRAATYVVDTNVILVANGQHPGVSEACVQRCARWLQGLMASGRLALDEGYEIVREYQHNTRSSDGQGVGDEFLRWVLLHLDDPVRCDLVPLKAHPQRGYEAFPDDARVSGFDAADRKFVALARAHPEAPPILQATDSKWLDWAAPLADHGVTVQFLCASDVHQFHVHKFGQ